MCWNLWEFLASGCNSCPLREPCFPIPKEGTGRCMGWWSFCISHGGFWLQGISLTPRQNGQSNQTKKKKKKQGRRNLSKNMGTRARPAWCVGCGAKRECLRSRQHPKVARTEKSGKVLTPRRQYLVGTICWVFLSWCPPRGVKRHEGDGTATCTVATSWFSIGLAASSQRNGRKMQRRSFAFKSSPGLSECLDSCFFLESSPKHVCESP